MQLENNSSDKNVIEKKYKNIINEDNNNESIGNKLINSKNQIND